MFSVVIPLYNKERHVGRAIRSVLNQTYKKFEIIIVDDGSTDNSASVVHTFNDARINLIRQKNAGVSSARNRGIEQASSDLIAFLDADDEWNPLFLETIRQLIFKYPDAGLFATAYETLTEDGKIIPEFFYLPIDKKGGLIDSYFKSTAFGSSPVCSSAVCIPRRVVNDVGFFPIGENLGEDLDMWARIALKYPIAFSSYVGGVYHVISDNRACVDNIPREELPFSKRLQARINKNDIPALYVDDVNMFISRHLIHIALLNLLSNRKKDALSVLLDSRVNIFWKERLQLLFCLMLPYKTLSIVKYFKRKVRKFTSVTFRKKNKF